VTNAVHHTDEGNRIRLGCRSSGEWVLIEVADSGDGISAADLPHVFAPWYRAGKQEGSVGGLGLMIVREVARAHGGDVDVISSKQSGTTFIIRLPRIVDEALPEVGTAAEPVTSRAAG
jgi:two-component system sensor histidine kinase BaeS